MKLLHVLLKELAMEIVPDGIIDETLESLRFTTGLVLKYDVIVPSAIQRVDRKLK